MPRRVPTLLGVVLALFSACALAGADDEVAPVEDAAETIVIYLSSSAGVDGQDGRSPETAVKTIRRGQALLRNGRADRLLLKRGDTFEEIFGNWTKSGKEADEPLVIGVYGDGPRPKVVAKQTIFNLYGNQPLLHDVRISGLHFVAAGRDPDAPDFDPAAPATHAIRIVRPVHRLAIEDCRFEFFNGNLTLTGDAKKGRLKDVAIRRCVVLDAYANTGAHSGQGLYADKIDGLTIEDSVFDHNGWNEKVPGAVPNIYRHNIYISHDTSDVVVRNNVIARGASHGMQMRSGGICEGNLFVDNAIHAFLGGESATFRRNVILGGRDINAKTPRGFGVIVAAGRGVVEDNLILHKPPGGDGAGGAAITVEVGKWSPPDGVHAEITGNVVYDWAGNGLEVTSEAKSVSFLGNDLQRVSGKGRKVVSIKKAVPSLSFARNRYHGEDAQREKWFNLPEGLVAPAAWGQKVRDASRLEVARYPDPDRALPVDFLSEARAENDGSTSAAAIASLREAFGKTTDRAARTPRKSAPAVRRD